MKNNLNINKEAISLYLNRDSYIRNIQIVDYYHIKFIKVEFANGELDDIDLDNEYPKVLQLYRKQKLKEILAQKKPLS